MTERVFDAARQRGTAQRIGQLNPMGRYGVAEGKEIPFENHSPSRRIRFAARRCVDSATRLAIRLCLYSRGFATTCYNVI